MVNFLNLQPEIFGMDINDVSVRLAKLKKSPKGFSVASFAEAPIKQGIIKEGIIQDKEALVKVIQQACSRVQGKKLGTKYVIASLPEEKAFSQIIQMPKMTKEELKSAVPFEAENYIPLTIDKVYLDFETINSLPAGRQAPREKESHLNILINVMPKPIVDAYVDCLKEAGLIPSIMEVEGAAIARALLKNGESRKPLVILDLGVSNTTFIVFYEGFIRFTYSIPISSQQLTGAIAENLGLDLKNAEELKIKNGLNTLRHGSGRADGLKKYNIEKAVHPLLSDLAAQIRKYMDFYYGHVASKYSLPDEKIEKIILCGGGANLKKLPAFLHRQLKIPVELGNPFANIIPQRPGGTNNIPYQKVLAFTTALGLALRGADSNII